MAVQQVIEGKIQEALQPRFLEVENESHRHGGAATESHFRITVVADAFEGLMAVKRHRQIYALLASELSGGVHALALHLYTPEEWAARQQEAPQSPDCRGGSRQDS